ncbi:C-type lectin domain family 4 member G-like isoform X3 [Bufo gargarizans]|uniref:C-type lectin domain family 4 member G-like isoform X3 n=1 Tax=Bufo gargarizans TaxID=30331 RepID=UPI001CF42A21|nr:C-type lectin domain family 4 member G-like isoform X3 [Bufo gargarizans]
MKGKERKNIQDGTGRNEHSHKDNVYGNMVELDKEPTLARSIEASTTMDDDISDDVYVNVDDLNKEAELKRSKEKKTPKTTKVSTGIATKARLILAALIFLFIMFLFLIVITSLLLKYYLAMSEEMSHQKNHDDQQQMVLEDVKTVKNNLENVKQNFLQDSKAINKTLENVKQNFIQDIKAINKTLEILFRTCPPQWKPIGLFCYYFSTDTLSWDNAKDECVRKGSALAFLKNKDETDALKPSIENGRYWIGLRRDTEPGKWKWVDGSMMSHSTWKKGEPNNPLSEHCAESVSGYWNDLPCERKLLYICKKCRCC